jgi:hypothetical protein
MWRLPVTGRGRSERLTNDSYRADCRAMGHTWVMANVTAPLNLAPLNIPSMEWGTIDAIVLRSGRPCCRLSAEVPPVRSGRSPVPCRLTFFGVFGPQIWCLGRVTHYSYGASRRCASGRGLWAAQLPAILGGVDRTGRGEGHLPMARLSP